MDPRCDLILRNGLIVDGMGRPSRAGDVAVADGSIVAVGACGNLAAQREIDVEGAVIAPGFIDVHTHDDRAMLSDPAMTPKVSQGVTTVVAGNCGISLAPLQPSRAPPPPLNLLGDETWFRYPSFADYVARLEAEPAAVNALLLVGHSTLRVGAMATLDRPATDIEIDRMRASFAEALDAGAGGLSTGLYYDPAFAAPAGEVVALAEMMAEAGGLYAAHMRNESDHVLAALDEALGIGRDARVKVLISHHKVQGARNFGLSRVTLQRIADARKSQPVALDVYPYIASSTVLNKRSLKHSSRTVVIWSEARPDLAGRTLAEIAALFGCSEEDAVDRLLPAGAIYFAMDEDDLSRILTFEGTMIGSDGLPHDAHPHPRLWGAFARVLGHYCRELGLLGLEDAVRRMTGSPAAELGLKGRGVLSAGNAADITVFDPATVADAATFEQPCQPAHGIRWVFVNGEAVWSDGKPTGARPGRVLRRVAEPARFFQQ
ncbi:MAG: D-aminoacylase [Proteobacteria bacterium]|nr:D-aminoacylase [Pseudomonadota bacterium]